MKEERIEWVDIAKGLGIICVVMGHIFQSQMLAHKIIYLFHMPLFFIAFIVSLIDLKLRRYFFRKI